MHLGEASAHYRAVFNAFMQSWRDNLNPKVRWSLLTGAAHDVAVVHPQGPKVTRCRGRRTCA